MHIDDAASFIIDFIEKPRNVGDYPSYGYDLYLPNVIAAYIKEVERSAEHASTLRGGARARELSPTFYEAAWELSRRGVLRPGVKALGGQSSGHEGDGYSVTALGRSWMGLPARSIVVVEPTRLGHQFKALSTHLGSGFLQRANEAARCYTFGCYLAACAMCGAAAESILLAVAIKKRGSEEDTLKLYRTAQGRRRVIDSIIGSARPAIAAPFQSAMALLAYWRDDAAHGLASNISEIEAHEAIARLLRFAQFAHDNWVELTT